MGEVVNVVVAFAVIVFIVRWATRGSGGGEESNHARNLLGFRPKNVTEDMVSTVRSMFPDIPRENIHYDLLRTGNVEVTSNKLLERGFLEPPPPAYFQLFPRPSSTNTAQGTAEQRAAAPEPSKPVPKTTLISRFNLDERLNIGTDTMIAETEAGGKSTWEATAERREASLRERKAQMILAARNRLLEQQKESSLSSSSS